jgi:hypothetical protein
MVAHGRGQYDGKKDRLRLGRAEEVDMATTTTNHRSRRRRPSIPVGIGGEKLARQLAAEQGVGPVENVDKLYDDSWPEDESVDDFIAAMKTWDKEGL